MSNETEAAPAGSNSPVRPSAPRALRIWPAVILVALMIITRFVPAFLEGGLAKYWMFAMMGPMVCCLLLVIWWLAASRATWKERVFGFLGLAAVFAMIMVLVEPLMRGPGTIYITLPMGMFRSWQERRCFKNDVRSREPARPCFWPPPDSDSPFCFATTA
jgi:hypothetical protein